MSDAPDAPPPADAAQNNNSNSDAGGSGGDPPKDGKPTDAQGDTQMDAAADASGKEKEATTAEAKKKEEPQEEPLPDEVLNASVEEIQTRTRLLENDIKVMRSENMRLMHEQTMMREKIKDNAEKIKQNKVLPYLVGNVVEVRTRVAQYGKWRTAD